MTTSPTPAAGLGGPAAGPDPISRWGGDLAGPEDLGKGSGPARLISPPRYDGGRCVCRHLDVFHNLGKRCGVKVRTGCSWTDGPQITTCGCELYQEAACS